MFKVSKIAFLLVLINLVVTIYADVENDDESVCKMETKKGLVQLKEKYKENINQWKELQKRGCAGKSGVWMQLHHLYKNKLYSIKCVIKCSLRFVES